MTSWSPVVLPQFGHVQNVTCFTNNSLQTNSSFRLPRLTIAVLCDQHDPKARLPSHHLRVRGGCLIKWDGLDHRRHPTQGTETKRCVSSGGGSRPRARSPSLSAYELPARELHRLPAPPAGTCGTPS